MKKERDKKQIFEASFLLTSQTEVPFSAFTRHNHVAVCSSDCSCVNYDCDGVNHTQIIKTNKVSHIDAVILLLPEETKPAFIWKASSSNHEVKGVITSYLFIVNFLETLVLCSPKHILLYMIL